MVSGLHNSVKTIFLRSILGTYSYDCTLTFSSWVLCLMKACPISIPNGHIMDRYLFHTNSNLMEKIPPSLLVHYLVLCIKSNLLKSKKSKLLTKKFKIDHKNTVGLLLRLYTSLCGTGKLAVFNSAFCVLRALTEMKNLGVCSHAVLVKVYSK